MDFFKVCKTLHCVKLDSLKVLEVRSFSFSNGVTRTFPAVNVTFFPLLLSFTKGDLYYLARS